MANYASLRSAIQEVITTNGNNEITGAILQQTLLSMINSLGALYQFVGVAVPNTNPGTPDQNVFYLSGPGTFPNFGNTTVTPGYIGVFTYDGDWSYYSIPAMSVVNNLDDGGTTAALSAEMGKLLNEKFTSIQEIIGEVSTDVTGNYTFQNNKQAYGNVGGQIQTGNLSGYSYCYIAKSSIAQDSYLRVSFNTSDANISSFVQFVNANGIITRRLYVSGEYSPQTSYSFSVDFAEGETGVYVTGKNGSISIIQTTGQALPDSIVNTLMATVTALSALADVVGELSDITVVELPANIVDAINKLGTVRVTRNIIAMSVSDAMTQYENTSLRGKFIYGSVGGNIQYTGNNENTRTATIPLDGVNSVRYPVFKSTAGFGSLIVDSNSKVVVPLINTTEETGTLVTIDTSSYNSGGYKIMICVYPYSSSESLLIELSLGSGQDESYNLKEYIESLVVDDVRNPSQTTVLSTFGMALLLQSLQGSSGLSFPFKDFGVMPSCLSTDPDNFLPDGVDGNGDALVRYANVVAKYDALVSAYPNYVTKTALGYDASGTIMIYSYTFTPKYWRQSVYLQAGVHGWEPDPVFALAEIMYLISNAYGNKAGAPYDADNDILLYLRGNVKFTIVPCVNPWGFNDRGDCEFSQARRGQNNYNNININGNWGNSNPQPEAAYVKSILTSLKDELSFTIDMHSTVHDDSRTRYGCFYGGYNAGALNVLTLMRTYEWLYRFYNVKYPSIVNGDSAPNPLGGGYASVGTMVNVFSSWCLATFGVQSSTEEFSDHTWTPELHTSIAMSVAVNMYLNQIVQQVCDGYVIGGMKGLPQSDVYLAKG